MKKILALVLSIIFVFSLAACGGDGKPAGGTEAQNQTEQQEIPNNKEDKQTPAAGTKTMAFFQKYVSGGAYTMELVTTAEGMAARSKNAYSGDMIYTETEHDGAKTCMIMKEGYQYMIDPATKTVMKMQIVNTEAVKEMFSDEAANYETASASGTTEHDGKTYNYEEFTVEGDKVQYLFDGDDLKLIKATVMGAQSVVEIVSIEKGADSALFEIPEGYQMITY